MKNVFEETYSKIMSKLSKPLVNEQQGFRFWEPQGKNHWVCTEPKYKHYYMWLDEDNPEDERYEVHCDITSDMTIEVGRYGSEFEAMDGVIEHEKKYEDR